MPTTVLVVEDEMLVRLAVVEALQEAGFSVLEAGTGEEALAHCSRHAADALVTDICLPGKITGWEVAEKCREHNPRLPVIYASAFSPEAARLVPGSVSLAKPYRLAGC